VQAPYKLPVGFDAVGFGNLYGLARYPLNSLNVITLAMEDLPHNLKIVFLNDIFEKEFSIPIHIL